MKTVERYIGFVIYQTLQSSLFPCIYVPVEKSCFLVHVLCIHTAQFQSIPFQLLGVPDIPQFEHECGYCSVSAVSRVHTDRGEMVCGMATERRGNI
jgi:hypothetical protein